MNIMRLSFMRTNQLCVLVNINIHTFSGILIFFFEIYSILHAKYSYREIIYYQRHINIDLTIL